MDIIALIIGVVGVVWTIIGIVLNNKTKDLILKEKQLIRDKILDIKQTLEGHYKKVFNDRETFNDPTRNNANIRIEDLESIMANLDRFAEKLK